MRMTDTQIHHESSSSVSARGELEDCGYTVHSVRPCGDQRGCYVATIDNRPTIELQSNGLSFTLATSPSVSVIADGELALSADELLREHRGW